VSTLPDSGPSCNSKLFLDNLTGTPLADADDLSLKSSAALWRELVAICLRLALDPRPHSWWAERDLWIRKMLRRRGCPC
jgi:hypothetical protein